MSRCMVCKTGEVRPGTTTLTVERGRMTLVLKGVPARVCGSESYLPMPSSRMLRMDLREGSV